MACTRLFECQVYAMNPSKIRVSVEFVLEKVGQVSGQTRQACAARSELSDVCLNTLERFRAECGLSESDMFAMVGEEIDRIRRCQLPINRHGLESYFSVPRTDSRFQISRSIRAAIFGQLAVRTNIENPAGFYG